MKILDLDIIKIFDKNKNLEITNFDIKQITHIYSNTKIPIYKLIIDNKQISRNNTFCVEYKCAGCDANNIITLNIFLRKVNSNNTKYCNLCKNADYE